MSKREITRGVGAALALLCASTLHAHFIFLLPQQTPDGRTTVQVYFAEEASPDDPALLKRITNLQGWQFHDDASPRELEVARTSDELKLLPVGDVRDAVFVAVNDFGVVSRGDKTFRLVYYAKTGPAAGHSAWNRIDTSRQLKLDVAPVWKDGKLSVTVSFEGRPAAGAQVVAQGPEYDVEMEADAEGRAEFNQLNPGVCSLRARHIEPKAGEVNGRAYADVRHYSTVAFEIPRSATSGADAHLANIPMMVTSFGGATLDGALYIYGGHTGSAHSYSLREQGDVLLRLTLDGKGEWESLAKGPPLQGLALVAHGGKLYRLGGFTAKNAEGENHDLWSQDSVAAFDPQTGTWTDLPPLPEPRSSFDAAVLGDAIYVIGGWQLRGEQESIWHPTAWKLDLSRQDREWTALPSPPFQRRALAVAAHDGKIYVVGGMQPEGGPTRRVDVFDPQTGVWTQGPDIIGDKGLAGFGAAAFACDGVLYVSTSEAKLQRLSADGKSWEIARDLPTGRFFHRLLPAGAGRIVIVGGANMGSGKFETVELVSLPPVNAATTGSADR